MKEHIADVALRRLRREYGKEAWMVEYIGSETGRVRRSSDTFPNREEAERHAEAMLGASLD